MQKHPGIYIHIPFCERKCTYCNFNTTDFFAYLAERYTRAVSREIKWWGEINTSQVDTIYFGGGTPSILEAEQLARILESCREAFDIAPTAEVTIEINPATLSRKKIAGWLDCGINRASVGAQSFIDRELISLSRTHTATDTERTIDSLREAGFENISLDLIAGLPEQTLADWQFNLEEALRIRSEHMSLYLLEIKEGTQLFAQLKRGLRPRPDDDLAATMYRRISEATREAGYEHYEISNFALIANDNSSQPSPLRSKHNMKYWTAAPFYGMGCGAHSFDTRARWVNTLKTESYIAEVERFGHAIAERHELSIEALASEALFMGLRLKEGIALDHFRNEHGVDVLERYGSELPRLADAGLIEIESGRIILTEAGRLLSNEVFVSFV
ncbi:MAG TPA: radical SAM family heme chaperone HemW [Blastocatellia bacterium]|nr:radical SAM family heme chaperone HemW [Blastocatellia bacterium]